MLRHPRGFSALAAVTGVLVGLGLVLTTLAVGEPFITLNSRTYAYETESLFGSQSYLSYQFHGVIFTFHLWCQVTADAGIVCGNATERDGTSYSYSFTDGLPNSGPMPWQTWVSPDELEAVEYHQGGNARLLVAVP
jgi:uncharacterized membrane protein YedE/YeeE